jgi:hypothetical protein
MVMFAGDSAKYVATMQLGTAVSSLSDEQPITLSFDVSGKDSTAGAWNNITLRNTSGNNLVAMRIGNDGTFQNYKSGWMSVTNLLSNSGSELSHVSIILGASGIAISVDGNLVTTFAYNNTNYATSFGDILIQGGVAASGMSLDNISVTTAIPEPVTLGLYSISGFLILVCRHWFPGR